MKRVRCPKCDNYIVFDETQYEAGQSLVFQCHHCKKEFSIRIGKSALTAIHQERTIDEHVSDNEYGSIIVVENVFHYKQLIALDLGDNYIGRYLKGTKINKPIDTRDPSIDTFHCVITVDYDKKGQLRYTIKDAPSNTGTFINTVILGDKEKRVITSEDIITIGATTLLLKT